MATYLSCLARDTAKAWRISEAMKKCKDLRVDNAQATDPSALAFSISTGDGDAIECSLRIVLFLPSESARENARNEAP